MAATIEVYGKLATDIALATRVAKLYGGKLVTWDGPTGPADRVY